MEILVHNDESTISNSLIALSIILRGLSFFPFLVFFLACFEKLTPRWDFQDLLLDHYCNITQITGELCPEPNGSEQTIEDKLFVYRQGKACKLEELRSCQSAIKKA